MTKQELYDSKLITLDQALDLIKSGDCVATGFYGDETRPVFRNIHKIADRVENVTVWLNNPQEEYPFLSMPELNGKLDVITVFYGHAHRRVHSMGRVSYVPEHLHDTASAILRTARPNIIFLTVAPMDKHGYVYCSCSLQHELECVEKADTVVFQVNRNLPRTMGTHIPIEAADYIIEETDEPIIPAPTYPVTEVERKIAENVATLVSDGDTVQFGIGGLPLAVAQALHNKNDLGIHTEMFSPPMGQLIRDGVVTNKYKNINKNLSVCAFMWGDDELHALADYNPAIRMMEVGYINDPHVVSQNDNMVSINSALEIDLTGQVCSERLGYVQFSGTGGATDFAYGAFHSKGGKGIIALNSTAKNGAISKIQPGLTPGSVVSISRNIVEYVVTEYGIAYLKDKSVRGRVEELINIAHPKFRDELRDKAKEYQLW